ncbi:hypothetical protein SAMN05216188_13133 [Lentzea xinjiangensis]|uniref:Uncharacterized protein n=1 Tax=Lentzea xinjiangensis TaxID=402600 RepID=A0A1H9W869_9PSEU|nr:hypothetical protein [Lentzea xinjiangensis]SES29981.1 hypothetical protein SAMN05216188_13133 [Lentzea xinjiangensis]
MTTAKTTGTAAGFTHSDGSEEPVYRKWGIAIVVEQIGIVLRAAAYRSDAPVTECVAVVPDLQEISQSKLIRGSVEWMLRSGRCSAAFRSAMPNATTRPGRVKVV